MVYVYVKYLEYINNVIREKQTKARVLETNETYLVVEYKINDKVYKKALNDTQYSNEPHIVSFN